MKTAKTDREKKVIVRLIKYTGLLPVFSEYDSRTWKTSFSVQSCRITDTNTFDSWERKKKVEDTQDDVHRVVHLAL